MKNEILFYEQNGKLNKKEILDNDNLQHANGMMTKCTLKDGTIEEGFCDVFKTYEKNFKCNKVKDYIYIWKWENLDEEKHVLVGNEECRYNKTFKKIIIKDIIKVECILYSNPRWEGLLTNKFILK